MTDDNVAGFCDATQPSKQARPSAIHQFPCSFHAQFDIDLYRTCDLCSLSFINAGVYFTF